MRAAPWTALAVRVGPGVCDWNQYAAAASLSNQGLTCQRARALDQTRGGWQMGPAVPITALMGVMPIYLPANCPVVRVRGGLVRDQHFSSGVGLATQPQERGF